MFIADTLSKTSNTLYAISCWVIKIILALMVFSTGLQIVCRIFFTALSWSEELTRYLLVWLTFIGAGTVYKTKGHISVLVVQDLLNSKMKIFSRILVNLLCLMFFVVATFYGLKYMSLQGKQLSAALRIPMKYIYSSIPIGFSIMAVYSLENFMQLAFGKEER